MVRNDGSPGLPRNRPNVKRGITTARLTRARLAWDASDTATATAMKVPTEAVAQHARVTHTLEFRAALRAATPGRTWTEHTVTWRMAA
ncbi:hypothetical protein SALCHL_002802 [Streptomyces albus subsp. chlorinus]|uniref:hypothetical protein n=1 Tax=Streptomyces albus TaxID=1888 RepID=UPI003D124E99